MGIIDNKLDKDNKKMHILREKRDRFEGNDIFTTVGAPLAAPAFEFLYSPDLR